MDRNAKIAQNNDKNKKWFAIAIDVFLGILLLVSVVHIAYLTFTKLDPYALHSEIPNEISYRLACFEQKTFFPEGFVHSHESFMSRPVLVYGIFYAMTQNFMLSYELENVAMLLVQLAALYFLLKQFSISLHAKLFSLCMYVIWQHTGAGVMGLDYAIFWPIDAYSVFYTLTYVALALYIKLIKANFTEGKKINILLIVLFSYAIAGLTGYTSPRFLVALYLPILMIECIRLVSVYTRKIRIQKQDFIPFLFSASLVIINGGGYWLLLKLHREAIATISPAIRPVSEWFDWSNLSLQFEHIPCVFGIYGSGAVKSVSGLIFVVRLCFAFLIVMTICHVIRKKHNQGVGFLLAVFVTSICFVLSYMIITRNWNLATRYFFPAIAIIPVLCGVAISEWSDVGNGTRRILPVAVPSLGLAVLLLLTATYVNRLYPEGVSDKMRIADYLVENEYRYVTASNWNAGVLKGYTNGKLAIRHSTEDGIINMIPYYWMIDSHVFEEECLGEPTILLLTDAEEKTIFDQKNGVYWMLETEGTKVKEIGEFNLYELHENPYTLLPKVEARRQEEIAENPTVSVFDYPGEEGLLYENAVLDASGKLVSNGDPGILLQVSRSDLEEGVYEIILHYKVRSYKGKEKAVLDFSLGNSEYRSTSIGRYATVAELEDVTVTEGQILQVRVWIPSGMEIEIESVEYRTPNK